VRYLVLSDLHANLPATRAVVAHAGARGFDRVVVLGDLVGYGAQPNDVIDEVRALEPAAVVRGNHDKVACGISDGSQFNEVALEAILWTRAALGHDQLEYLRGLPAGPIDAGGFLLSHGAPEDEEAYLFTRADASVALKGTDFSLAMFGHTHFACAFHAAEPGPRLRFLSGTEDTVKMSPGERWLINPGSIGQPRDQDPRASYALYDSAAAELTVIRVPYDIPAAQREIRAAGLPEVLAARLALGV